jgi:hypothetical protein
VSRAALIRWKLLRSQILILINTLLWIFITRRARPPLPFPIYLVSLWVLFTTLSLHRLGAALTRAGIRTHWKTGLRRQWVVIAIAVAAVVALVVPLVSQWPALMDRCCGLEFWTLLGTSSIGSLPLLSCSPSTWRWLRRPRMISPNGEKRCCRRWLCSGRTMSG